MNGGTLPPVPPAPLLESELELDELSPPVPLVDSSAPQPRAERAKKGMIDAVKHKRRINISTSKRWSGRAARALNAWGKESRTRAGAPPRTQWPPRRRTPKTRRAA